MSDFYKKPFPNIGLKTIEEFFQERNEMQNNNKIGLPQEDNLNQQNIIHEQTILDPKKINDQQQILMENQELLEELNDSFPDSSADSQNLNKKSIFLKGTKIVKQLVGKIFHFKNNNRMQSKKRKDIKCTCKKNQCCNLYCGCYSLILFFILDIKHKIKYKNQIYIQFFLYQIQKHCTKSCKCNKIECHNMPITSSQFQQL